MHLRCLLSLFTALLDQLPADFVPLPPPAVYYMLYLINLLGIKAQFMQDLLISVFLSLFFGPLVLPFGNVSLKIRKQLSV